LTELGENIPESVTPEAAKEMIAETLNMYSEVYDDAWSKKGMKDNTIRNIVKFYCVITSAAFFCRPKSMLVYFVCRSVQLSLQEGNCQRSPQSLIQFAMITMSDDNAEVT
jgi:hypothetical protein